MTDILTRVFRNFTSQTHVKEDLTVNPPFPTTYSTLVVGDHITSRSLLLLVAVTAASQMGMRVVFFTQTQIQRLPVSLQKCVPSRSQDSLKQIKFCYPRTVDELLQQVACLHESISMYPASPSLVIVDRIEGYLRGPGGSNSSGFHPGEQSCAAYLSALLCDTAIFLTEVLTQRCSSSAPCHLIASFLSEVDTGQTSGEAFATDPILCVLDRYFQVRCTLDLDKNYGATESGLQEVWHIYFSGTGITKASSSTDCENRPSRNQEWQLLIFTDGLMEFKVV